MRQVQTGGARKGESAARDEARLIFNDIFLYNLLFFCPRIQLWLLVLFSPSCISFGISYTPVCLWYCHIMSWVLRGFDFFSDISDVSFLTELVYSGSGFHYIAFYCFMG